MTPNDAPEFSVIITCYNKRTTIEAAIASARAQASGTEVIVVDDGSTDGSRDILATANVDRVILHQDNRGALGAYLTGLRAARGQYLVLLDGDDRLADDILADLSETGWLDDGTCLRMGMAEKAPDLPSERANLPLKRALTFRPGRLFTQSQSTGGTAYILPRALFVHVDSALDGKWPAISVQDHVLPGMIGLVAQRFIKLASCGYLISATDETPRLSRQIALLQHDRLLSDYSIAVASEKALRQGAFTRTLLRCALILRLRKLAHLHGFTVPKLHRLLISSAVRAQAVQRAAVEILASDSREQPCPLTPGGTGKANGT